MFEENILANKIHFSSRFIDEDIDARRHTANFYIS